MNALAFYLYLLFMCSWFMHLPARIPALAAVRADLLLVSVIILLILLGGEDENAPKTAATPDYRTRNLLIVLVAYCAITIPLVEWPGTVAKIGFPNFFKAAVFFFFTSSLVSTPRRLATLLCVFLACQSFRVFEPLYLHITEGYWGSRASMQGGWDMMNRLSGAPDDTINPNGLASIVVTVVPLLHYLTAGSVLGRLLYVSALPGLLWALVLTASRSGMVGLAAIFAQIWWKSKNKVAVTAIVVVSIWVAIPFLGADLSDRYRSIFDSNTKNATTAGERMEGMRVNMRVAMRRPLFGYGLGTSEEANWNFGNSDLPAHNLYLETLQELGACGLILFLMFVWSVIAGLRRAAETLKRSASPTPILSRLVPALQVFVGMSLLFSFASYGLSQYDWYLTAGLTEVIGRLLVPAAVAVPLAASEPVPLGQGSFEPLPLQS